MQRGRTNPLFLLLWASLAVVLYFGMDALIKPKTARVSVGVTGVTEVVIPRSLDGHYYVEGAVNGHAMTFMVDTGASSVVIDEKTARAIRLPKGYATTFNTASGEAPGEVVPKQSVTVGGVRIDELSVAVIDGVGDHGLLGQNFLRHVDVIQSGNQMTLRAKAPK